MDDVVKMIQRHTGLPELALTDDADLVEDLGTNLLTLNAIILAMEKKYGTEEVPLNEIAQVKTIRDIKDLVRRYVVSI